MKPDCPNCGYMSWVEPQSKHESHAAAHGAHMAHNAHKAFHADPLTALVVGVGAYALSKLTEKKPKEWKCTNCGHEF